MRDTVDVYAFHVDVPAGTKIAAASFKFLSPTAGNQGRVLTTPDMLSLEWDSVSLYPAGYFVRDIPFSVSVTYPTGWKSATALAPGLSGDHVTYPTVDYETLVDSPAIAGRNMRSRPARPRRPSRHRRRPARPARRHPRADRGAQAPRPSRRCACSARSITTITTSC